MKILSASQIRDTDAYTIEHEPIASAELMERASQVFAFYFMEKFPPSGRVVIFCGIGNNGGDGLCVARLLAARGYAVTVVIVRFSDKTSADFAINFKRLQQSGAVEIMDVHQQSELPELPAGVVVIDSIFGSGLNRPPGGLAGEAVAHINASPAAVVALDIPSGVFADEPTPGPAVEADFTLSFQAPKLALLLPDNFRYTGQWEARSIGLSEAFIERQATRHYLVERELARCVLRERKKIDHKGTYGHAQIVAGSRGKMGASALCALGCLRSGVGLLTMHVPGCGYQIMQQTVIEAMTTVDDQEEHITHVPLMEKRTCIGIGPGLGTAGPTAQAFHELMKKAEVPLIIDADGLNILSQHNDWLKELPAGSILTPHPGEFARLAGRWENDFDKLDKLRALAKTHEVVIVLKGAHTTTACPDGMSDFNTTGNPGMATAGSGDVLTGMLTAFLGQGIEAFTAAKTGVYLHGLAGDQAAKNRGKASMIATDIIDQIPKTIAANSKKGRR